MQNQIAENGQEPRPQAESKKAGAYQGQEDNQRQHPGEKGKGKTAAYVRTGNARFHKVRIDERKAQADTKMDCNRGVEHIGGVFNHDVVCQALKPR